MADFSIKKPEQFLENDSRDLQTVYAKIHLLEQLSAKVIPNLDKDIAKFCQVGNLINGKLILIVANGSIATQLRFQSTDLLRKLRADAALKHITAIEYKVRPPQAKTSPRLASKPAKNMPALSKETAEIVQTIAESIADPGLKEIMARIAKRVKQGNRVE